MKISVNWLKDYLALPPPIERIAECLTMAGLEVKKIEELTNPRDTIFEIEITSNRPDWLSHLGVAREIAAIENLSLKIPAVDSSRPHQPPKGWKVELKEAEGCPYYTGVYLEGMSPAKTPDFMKNRLEACGVRSIDLIVDITNYVLLETGQPLHAFDADLLKGQEIQIRKARPGEEFVAISGEKFQLKVSDLVIADENDAVALAGVMGGKLSAISARSRNLFLESAYFHPRWVRQSSRRLGLSSESSYRFERRVDPEGVDYARERALALMIQYAKPRFVSASLRAGEKPPAGKSILHFAVSDLEKYLGVKIKSHQAVSCLTRLGFEVKTEAEETLKVRIPSFRSDVTRSVDLIEEIARLHGYDQIPETLPARAPLEAVKNDLLKVEDVARNYLVSRGAFETVTFSLISSSGLDPENLKDAVQIKNSLNQELTLMRPRLLTSLLGVLKKNLHAGAKGGAFFEIANTYRNSREPQLKEAKTLGILISGKWRQKSWLDPERDATFYDLKGIVSSLLSRFGIEDYQISESSDTSYAKDRGFEIKLKSQTIGSVGEVSRAVCKEFDIDPPAYAAEIFLPRLLPHVTWTKTVKPLLRFPSIERDLSVDIAETVSAESIQQEILDLGRGRIACVELFDLYRGKRIAKGRKSLAFRVVYQALDRTLISEEVQHLHDEIAQAIVKKHQASFQTQKSGI